MNKTIESNGVKFELTEVAPMEISGYMEFVSSKKLAVRITTYLKDIFKDYKGTSLKLANGKIQPILWFSMGASNPNAPITAMKVNDEKTNEQKWTNTFSRMNSIISGKNNPYVLSEEAKKVLVAFFPNEKVKWGEAVSFREEKPQQSYFFNTGKTETLMKVSGIDIAKLLLFIHGDSKEVTFDGETKEHKLCYDVAFVQMLHPERMQMQQMSPFGGLAPVYDDGMRDEMLLKVTAIDINVMNEMGALLGAYPDTGNVPMY